MRFFVDNGVISKIQGFLMSIDYADFFPFVPFLLMVLFLLSRSICLALTVLSPAKFGADHRKTMSAISRTCFWIAILAQCLIWIFGSCEQIDLINDVDKGVGIAAFLLAFIAFVIATIGMIFSRKGKRVFIAKSIYTQAIMLVLYSAFVSVFGWLFMR